jgi:hypothetical protein
MTEEAYKQGIDIITAVSLTAEVKCLSLEQWYVQR